MEFSAFAAGVQASKSLAPAYVFYGAEAYLRDQAVRLLQSADPGFAGNSVRCSSSETTWAAVSAELHTPSFLGGRKLVILVDEGNFIHNHLGEFAEYLGSPSPTAILAATVPSEKPPGLREGGACFVECRPLKPQDRIRWVQSEAQRLGKAIDRGAAEGLARRGGEDLGGLAGHLANLALYVGGRARIAIEDVDRLVAGQPEREIYELALATARKVPKQALEIAHSLLQGGSAPQQLLWRLAWQYRKLVEAKKLLLAGRRRFEVTSLLQITYYPDEFLGLVDAHGLDELLSKHGEILNADIALKTSGGQEQAIMESLVLRLAA